LVEKFDEQVEQALINMKNVLEEGGSSLSNVIQTTLLLTSMEDFQRVNEIYSTCLNSISSKS
jgi:2-iminobutanoate/2-iminopropanoate deaminase